MHAEISALQAALMRQQRAREAEAARLVARRSACRPAGAGTRAVRRKLGFRLIEIGLHLLTSGTPADPCLYGPHRRARWTAALRTHGRPLHGGRGLRSLGEEP